MYEWRVLRSVRPDDVPARPGHTGSVGARRGPRVRPPLPRKQLLVVVLEDPEELLRFVSGRRKISGSKFLAVKVNF